MAINMDEMFCSCNGAGDAEDVCNCCGKHKPEALRAQEPTNMDLEEAQVTLTRAEDKFRSDSKRFLLDPTSYTTCARATSSAIALGIAARRVECMQPPYLVLVDVGPSRATVYSVHTSLEALVHWMATKKTAPDGVSDSAVIAKLRRPGGWSAGARIRISLVDVIEDVSLELNR